MGENYFLRRKLVAVGDTQCGKSALLYMFAKELFLEVYVPTLFENYAAEIESRQGIVQVSMYDTPGDDNYSHIRPLSYPDTDIILLCFDLSSPISYQNIFTKWIPEILEYCPGVPFLIIGCKSDISPNMELRKPQSYIVSEQWPVTPDEVTQMLTHTGSCGYFTCSAKLGDNLIGLFSKAVESTFQRKKHYLKKYRNRTLSAANSQPEPTISCSSSFRRRAYTDVSTNRKHESITHEESNCLPTFQRRRGIVNENEANYPSQSGTCSIL